MSEWIKIKGEMGENDKFPPLNKNILAFVKYRQTEGSYMILKTINSIHGYMNWINPSIKSKFNILNEDIFDIIAWCELEGLKAYED